MRTTLKRGMGRGAAVNGNGRAVLPPAVASPITFYRQPPPERRGAFQLLARMLLWLTGAVIVVAVGLAAGGYLYYHESVHAIAAHTPAVKLAQKRLDILPPGRPAIALVIGYDKRAGIEKVFEARSDTVMLLRADPDQKALSMLSFPRDLIVDLRCPGKPVRRGRINEAYTLCGPQGTLETVRALTGLPINYLVTVNFRGFKQMVAKLGGVWIDVDRRYFNDNSGCCDRYATIDLQPGYQKLNGSDALDFVRYRHTDSDLYRLARQQLFVQAFRQAVTAGFSPTKLPRIVNVITDNVEVGVPGGKALDGKTVLRYGLFAYQLPSGHVFQSKIEGLSGYAELTTDPANVQAAVREFTSPDVDAASKATAVALGRKPKTKQGPAARDVPVTVLNGNGVTGAASTAAFELGKIGYQILTPPNGAPANAPSFDYFHTKVYFDPRRAGSDLAARKVGNIFGDADVERVPREIKPLTGGAMLVVVVGQTFDGTVAPAPVDKTPEKQPPAIRDDAGTTAPALLPVRKQVPFPVLVPTVLERTSYLDRSTPLRVYTIGGHKTLRLTYRTGASEYWGIQMIRWEDAPVLAQPNTKLKLKGGRRLELHYSGPKLHLIVLRANGASYWVVNTVLNSLSNETMLAIAKGLKPLRG